MTMTEHAAQTLHREYCKKLRPRKLLVIGKFKDYGNKIAHQCENGHIFSATPAAVLRGSGCSVCENSLISDNALTKNSGSNGEKMVRKALEIRGLPFTEQQTFEGLVGTGGGH